jgi:hypothetical protein
MLFVFIHVRRPPEGARWCTGVAVQLGGGGRRRASAAVAGLAVAGPAVAGVK